MNKKIVEARMKILKEMNNYIILIGDEKLWYERIVTCDNDTLEEIAENKELWSVILNNFSTLINDYEY